MTIGSHQTTIGKSQTWITPKWIIDALGPFDLDPCAADPRPWDCASTNYAWPSTDGLAQKWLGRVWLNPPFHRYEVGEWLKRMANHRSGIALVHARTEAQWFEWIWAGARAILFLADRLHFHHQDGKRARANSGAPPCLAAFSEDDAIKLSVSEIPGVFIERWRING